MSFLQQKNKMYFEIHKEVITLILFLTALNTILILYFHWQQEERNLEVLNRLKRLEDSGKE